MKRVLLITLMTVLVITMFGSFTLAAKYNFKFATMPSKPHVWIDVMEEFARKVEEQTNGEVKVQLFTSGQLGTDEAVIENMKFGVIDFNIGTPGNASGFIPELQLFSLGYLFRDRDHFKKVINPESELFNSLARKVQERHPDLMLLAFTGGGTRNLNTNFGAINTPEGLEGHKMRIMESPIETKIWSAFGVIPVTVPWTELYTAIQTGVAECFESSTTGYLSAKLYEVGKYHHRTEHKYMVGVWLASRRSFEKLPENYQKIVKEVAWEAGLKGIEKGFEMEAGIMAELEEKGVRIVRDVDKDAFARVVKPLHDELAAELGVTEELKLVRQALEN